MQAESIRQRLEEAKSTADVKMQQWDWRRDCRTGEIICVEEVTSGDEVTEQGEGCTFLWSDRAPFQN